MPCLGNIIPFESAIASLGVFGAQRSRRLLHFAYQKTVQVADVYDIALGHLLRHHVDQRIEYIADIGSFVG